MRPRKRTTWFEGDVAKLAAHDGRKPLVRDWREGEPLLELRSLVAIGGERAGCQWTKKRARMARRARGQA